MPRFFVLVFLLALPLISPAADPAVFPHPERIRYDAAGLQIEGKDVFVYSGAFHYFRVPRELWRDRFEKMKAAGFNGVETYVPWNWHERQAPTQPGDYSQLNLDELQAWIAMAESFGFYITIRPGPYICAEWDGGGFPQWLVALKRPRDWPAGKQWLQTDEPTFLAWNKHWYDAVCRVVAPHQITRKPAGSAGVIFFQIENEFNRVSWISAAVKKRYLEALTDYARAGGIDVPIVTCWTNESRNVASGPLCGIFDFLNRYPKWEVEKQLAPNTAKQRASQPQAPLMSMELQGGWYSEVGGKLSHQQDGIAPVQTQNLTLYCVQLGYSYINYYMLVGGTNFDDWASRETTTTYDFAAAIGEGGVTGERYARLAAIGEMLREHGARLMRSEPVAIEAASTDAAIQVVLKRAADGGRYFFVRTEERERSPAGVVTVKEKAAESTISFEASLEPFGAKVFYLPPGIDDVARGEWLPKPAGKAAAQADLPAPVQIVKAERAADVLPAAWTPLAAGETLEQHGVMDRHFVYYRLEAVASGELSVERIGDKVVNDTRADGVLAWANGRLLPRGVSDVSRVTFSTEGQGAELYLLWENRGLHHHTKPELERYWNIGVRSVSASGKPVPLAFASVERERGEQYSKSGVAMPGAVTVSLGAGERAPDALLSWYQLSFELPSRAASSGAIWKLSLEAVGNGFIYLNGRCIGRTWQEGPQRDFYLPEPWLNFRPGAENRIAISLCPVDEAGVGVKSAVIKPVAILEKAE